MPGEGPLLSAEPVADNYRPLAAKTKTKVMKRMMRSRRSTLSGTGGMKVSGLVTSEGRSPPAGDLPPPPLSVPAAALFPAKTHQLPTANYTDDVL